MTIAQDQANSGVYANAMDIFNESGRRVPAMPGQPANERGEAYLNGIDTGPIYFALKPDQAATAQQRGIPTIQANGLTLVNEQTPGVRGGIGSGALLADQKGEDFLKTVGPALAVAGLGVAGGLAGFGGAAEGASALAPAASTAYDPALMNAAYSGMGATGVGSTAAGLGAGGEGLLAAGSSLPVDAGIAGFGGASTLGGLGAAGSALGGLGGASGASGLTSTQNSTFGIPNNVLGGIAQGALGVLGANAQGDALKGVASDYLNIGAPYRGQLAASYQPGFDLMSQPGYGDAFKRSADIAARSYSAKMGNPADNPTAQAGILSDVWNQSYLPALSNYRGQLGQFGGLGLNTSGSASLAGAGSTGDAWNAVGAGLNTALNPPTDIASLLKQLNSGGNNFSLTAGGLPVK